MLSELVRVTKPGGRVAVIVRAMDMPWWVNLPLDAAVKASVEARMGSGVILGMCRCQPISAHARRGIRAGQMFPQLATFTKGNRFGDGPGAFEPAPSGTAGSLPRCHGADRGRRHVLCCRAVPLRSWNEAVVRKRTFKSSKVGTN
jgi:hypothetical protein